jgi:GNAT superfamily N-acetyltransferase
MTIQIVRATRDLMDEVRACINSNSELYESISDPKDLNEHVVSDEWAERNFKIREFYLVQDDDSGEFLGEGSFQVLGTFAYIGYFYIKAGHQQNGLGRQLMEYLEQRALDEGLHDLRLFVHRRATWARAFYTKLGFMPLFDNKRKILAIEDGIMKPFYEEGSIMMQKLV